MTPPVFEVLPHPVSALMPLVRVATVIVGVVLAAAIANPVARLGVSALVIAVIARLYLTDGRRLAVGEDAVDVETSWRKVRIPYSRIDHVLVRPMALGGTLSVKIVLTSPTGQVWLRIPLTSDDVRRTAPRLARALAVHGVEVRD